MSEQKNEIVEVDEHELEQVEGGVLIGLLLPAVQKVEGPASPTTSRVKTYVCPSDPQV
jgi:hypothetical protein